MNTLFTAVVKPSLSNELFLTSSGLVFVTTSANAQDHIVVYLDKAIIICTVLITYPCRICFSFAVL